MKEIMHSVIEPLFVLAVMTVISVNLRGEHLMNCESGGKESGKTNTKAEPATGWQGMVSSAHPIATEAGLEILRRGGNAFDAAVAVAATLNVVEPMMSGMGGYGTILVYDAAKKRVRFLNSSGRIPAGVDSDTFREPTPDFLKNRRGPKAVSTPGNVHAWEAMSRQYGKLEWSELFAPAVRAAEEGMVLDGGLAATIREAFESFPEQAKRIYGKDGKALTEGERLAQKDLGASLRLVAREGPGAFSGGRLGKAIDEEMRRTDGFLRMEDLKNDRAEWWEPIHMNYRGFEVYTSSPPATSFCSLVRLGLMSRFDVKAMGHNSLDMLHAFCEATKHAFWCRLRYAGDPEVGPPPLAKLLSDEYWTEQAGLIDMKRAKPFKYPGIDGLALAAPWVADKEDRDEPAGSPGRMSGKNGDPLFVRKPDLSGRDEGGGDGASGHTTHFVVADAEGNIVCATQTLGNLFGSRIMPEGTGIWLNNSLAYCTFEPKGNPMDAHAGRRKLSGDCPTIIMKGGTPWAALGTPGGHTIGQTVPQMVMNLVDFGMNIQEALAAPRVSFVEPDKIEVEEAVLEAVRRGLEARGHNLRPGGGLGNAHGIMIEYGKDGRPAKFSGGSDPRGRGLAKGY